MQSEQTGVSTAHAPTVIFIPQAPISVTQSFVLLTDNDFLYFSVSLPAASTAEADDNRTTVLSHPCSRSRLLYTSTAA